MISQTNTFRHVSYLWDDAKAAQFDQLPQPDREVALLIYRSNMLGADLRLTNYGGGNTSCKAMASDPLTGQPTEVMWVKGSGGDIGTLTRSGLAALYVDRLRSLQGIYRGIDQEDEMVELFNHCILTWPPKPRPSTRPCMVFCRLSTSTTCTPTQPLRLQPLKTGNALRTNFSGGRLAG
ncbi:MAG TPA: hypothetical protein VK404_04915 [Spirosoma sp.]|nr:hypothetical protein [Spirosoma sp.]